MATKGLAQTLNAPVPLHCPFPDSVATPDSLPRTNTPVLLHQPIVIPQRRPGSKERGFISAYAPCLEQHGIDQEAFLNFLSECNLALQGSASVQAVRVATELVSLAPDPTGISNGVAAGVGLVAAATAVFKSTSKVNTFLDKHNEALFLPRGLFCMIVTHEPAEKIDTDPSNSRPPPPPKKHSSNSLAPQLGVPAWAKNLKDPYRKRSSGLPSEIASLTFHEHDSTSSGEVPGGSGFKRFMGNMDSYLDDRALARYAVNNDGDAIVKSQPKRAEFKSRYLDPTHPATTGGIAGLLSGGRVTDKGVDKLCSVNLIQRQVVAAATGRSTKETQDVSRNSVEAVLGRTMRKESLPEAERKLGTRLAGLVLAQDNTKKRGCEKETMAFTKRILYLAIVDLHSVSEFASRNQNTGGGVGRDEGLGDLVETLFAEMTEGIMVI